MVKTKVDYIEESSLKQPFEPINTEEGPGIKLQSRVNSTCALRDKSEGIEEKYN